MSPKSVKAGLFCEKGCLAVFQVLTFGPQKRALVTGKSGNTSLRNMEHFFLFMQYFFFFLEQSFINL